MYIEGPDLETGVTVQRQVGKVLRVDNDGRYTCLMADGGIEGGINPDVVRMYNDDGLQITPEVTVQSDDAALLAALQILLGGGTDG